MKKIRKIIIVFLLLLGFSLVTTGLLYNYYCNPVSDNNEVKEVTIEKGTISSKIGTVLEENNLIKSSLFFKLYLKLNNINDLNYGKFYLREDMSLKEIVSSLEKNSTSSDDEISITFKEGINMRKLATIIAKNTNNTYEEVLEINNDKEYLEELIDKYWFINEDILNKDIYYALEGYLYPDTYRFTSKDVSVKEIFNKLIKQMEIILTPFKEDILNNEYSIHELLTLASISELEVSKSSDRSKVISVFLNRLSKKMSLGSDITTRYAVKLDDTRALKKSEYNMVSPYNTRSNSMSGKIPVGPICMFSKESISASIYPEKTNYLFFISNIKTKETFFYEKSSDFEKKKKELSSVNGGY